MSNVLKIPCISYCILHVRTIIALTSLSGLWLCRPTIHIIWYMKGQPILIKCFELKPCPCCHPQMQESSVRSRHPLHMATSGAQRTSVWERCCMWPVTMVTDWRDLLSWRASLWASMVLSGTRTLTGSVLVRRVTDRQTDKQTDKQTDRQTCSQIAPSMTTCTHYGGSVHSSSQVFLPASSSINQNT